MYTISSNPVDSARRWSLGFLAFLAHCLVLYVYYILDVYCIVACIMSCAVVYLCFFGRAVRDLHMDMTYSTDDQFIRHRVTSDIFHKTINKVLVYSCWQLGRLSIVGYEMLVVMCWPTSRWLACRRPVHIGSFWQPHWNCRICGRSGLADIGCRENVDVPWAQCWSVKLSTCIVEGRVDKCKNATPHVLKC